MNVTTHEQSDFLIKIGIPVDSADCVRIVRTGMVFFIPFEQTASNYINEYNNFTEEINSLIKAEACWSTAQLMEIFDKCCTTDICKEWPKTTVMKQYSEDINSYVFNVFKKAYEKKLIDFSKLK